jgi:hypothetical protein
MFDGIEHLNIGDLQRAVVDFAVASESCLRNMVIDKLPKDLDEIFKMYIDEANFRQVINKFLPNLVSDEKKRAVKKLDSDLHKLFNDRNKIMHSGFIDGLTAEKCKKYLATTREVITIFEST